MAKKQAVSTPKKTIIGAWDVGTSKVKVRGSILENNDEPQDIKIPTCVHEITEDEYDSNFFETSICLDFVDYFSDGNLSSHYYTVGYNIKTKSVMGDDADWRFKYTPSVYTPAFWYSVAELAQTLGLEAGEYDLKAAICYNVNILSDFVSSLVFPVQPSPNNIYGVQFKVNGVGGGIFNYRFTVDSDNRKGHFFVKETNASLIYRKLANKGESDIALVDIGHGTSQIYIVEDGKIVGSQDLGWGIGEVQHKIERDLYSQYGMDKLKRENIGDYMRDASLPEKDRRFTNSILAKDVANSLHKNGYELAHSIVNNIPQGYLDKIWLAGGGGVQLSGLIGEILHNKRSAGLISKVVLPQLLVGIRNNEFANAYGAYEAICLRNKEVQN